MNNNQANHSRSREAIFQVLLNNEECLTVSKISKYLAESYPKEISINTIYRHLNFFIKCGLVLTIQDDFKRAYYCLAQDNTMFFSVCSRCNDVKKIDAKEFAMCDMFHQTKFVTLHKKCKKCK